MKSPAIKLRGLQSGLKDIVQSKESSKLCILQKQEQFPQCSSGSNLQNRSRRGGQRARQKSLPFRIATRNCHSDSPLCCNTPLLLPHTLIWPEHQERSCLGLFQFQSFTSEQMNTCYLLCYSISQMPGDTKDLAITDGFQGRRNIMVACHFLHVA